jgi:hypothetical protein
MICIKEAIANFPNEDAVKRTAKMVDKVSESGVMFFERTMGISPPFSDTTYVFDNTNVNIGGNMDDF